MKIKSLLFIFIFSFSISALHSQNNNHNCGSHEGYLDEQKQKYPNFYKSIESKNLQLEDQKSKLLSKTKIILNIRPLKNIRFNLSINVSLSGIS